MAKQHAALAIQLGSFSDQCRVTLDGVPIKTRKLTVVSAPNEFTVIEIETFILDGEDETPIVIKGVLLSEDELPALDALATAKPPEVPS